MSKVRHVKQNLVALEAPVLKASPDRQLLGEVLDILKPVANICWQEGIPENFDPGAVPQQSD